MNLEELSQNEELYVIDKNYYYVYEHWLNNELIYIGKGKKNRAFKDSRNNYWNNKVRNSRNKIKVVIKGYFKCEEDALLFENSLIEDTIRDGINLTNIAHNLKETFNEYTSDVNNLTKATEKEADILNENIKNAFKFYHSKELYDSIRNVLSKNGNKVVIFSNNRSYHLINNLTTKPGIRMLHLSNFDSKGDEKSIKNLKEGLIPNPYNVLVYPISSLKSNSTIIKDKKVELIIVNTEDNVKIIESLSKIKNKVKLIAYRNKFNTNSSRRKYSSRIKYSEGKDITIEDKYLNKYLTVKDKAELADDLDLMNSNGRQIKWPSIKKILLKENYVIDEKTIRIEGKQVRVSIIRPKHYTNLPEKLLNTPLLTDMKRKLSGLLNTPLTSNMKEALSEEFNLLNESGRQLKWPSIKKILISMDYTIDEKTIRIDKKQVRVSIVRYPAADDSI